MSNNEESMETPPSKKVYEIFTDSLFAADEIKENGVPPDGAILVNGLVINAGFHPGRLESHRAEIVELIKTLVKDEFFQDKGGGYSFLELCNDRFGMQWAEHRTMDEFFMLAKGLGLAGYCIEDRRAWAMLPGGMAYIWFTESV